MSRPTEVQDSSTPSATAMAVMALLRLGKLTGRTDYLAAAEATLKLYAGLMAEHPMAAGQMLLALDFREGPTPELVLVAAESAERAGLLADLRRRYWPNKLLAARPTAKQSPVLDPLFAGKQLESTSGTPREPMLFVCENFACQAPAVGQDAIRAEFERCAR